MCMDSAWEGIVERGFAEKKCIPAHSTNKILQSAHAEQAVHTRFFFEKYR